MPLFCSTCVTCFDLVLTFQFVQSFFRKATAQTVELIALPRCQARADARKAKDFAKADAIRDELTGTAGHSRPPRVFQVSSEKDQKSLRRPLRLCKIHEFLLSKEWNWESAA